MQISIVSGTSNSCTRGKKNGIEGNLMWRKLKVNENYLRNRRINQRSSRELDRPRVLASVLVLSRIKPSSTWTCGECGVAGCKSPVSGGNQKATTDQYNYRDECFHLMRTVYLSRAT